MDRVFWPSNFLFSFHTLLISLSFLHVVSASAVTTPVPCLPDQRSALLQLKEGFIINSNLTSWQPGTDCCHGWEGVSCDKATGQVTTIDLNSYNIQGNLSVAIFNLTSLQHLNLAYNCISHAIPDGFEKLTNLTQLNLSSSCFSGQIPIGIANLTKLSSLDLSNNCDLRLHKPNLRTLINKLSNLRQQYLDCVDVSENGTEWCGALSESVPLLQVLSMSSCNLSGPIEASLSRLHSLTKIDLGGNSIQSSIPDYFSDFPLKYLQLKLSDLVGSFPPKIFQIPTLIFLDISLNLELTVGAIPNVPRGSSLECFYFYGTKYPYNILDSIVNLQNLSFLELSNSGNSLSGEIPSSIGKLVKLQYLDLRGNALHGSIPQSLFALPNLDSLDLSYNNLSGQLRLEEGSSISFSPLTNLNLINNQLTGSIPRAIYKLSNLEELYLSENQFSGPIPSSIFGFLSLQVLDLSNNNFNGTFKLNLLQHLPNLDRLYLSDNQLSLEDVSNEDLLLSFPKITTFYFASCNLSQIPSLLRYHNSLAQVDLSNNHIHGVIPSWIWEKFNSSSSILDLSYNKFTSIEKVSICPTLPSCWIFDTIDFSYNKIKGNIPSIGACFMDYSNNELSGIPSNFAPYLNQTSFLFLSYNNFSGSLPSCIFEAPSLELLNLASNKFHGKIPNKFPKDCNIGLLDLSNNDLNGELPKTLTRCTNLMVLNMENNRIVDMFPFWLGETSNLQVLSLRSNQLYGTLEVPSKLASNISLFQSLRVIDLASNNIDGSLPLLFFENLRSMVNLTLYETNYAFVFWLGFAQTNGYGIPIIDKGIRMNLETISASLMVEIDLSCNRFNGDIPEVISKLRALSALNLSHNAFTGSIPHSFKDLDRIESLDLSWNNLSGEIPQELTSLDALSKLNLSFNHLGGRIPQSPHFTTFDNSSFEGNPRLCGVPLSKLCDVANLVNNSTSPDANFAKKVSGTVLLYLFIGLGFGTGFATIILYPVIKRTRHSTA